MTLCKRLDSYPFNSHDQYRLKADSLGAMSEALHSNCFELCATRAPELPFLSVQEGLCFRNCLTKFSVFYPTLKQNLESADYHHYNQQFVAEASKKDANIRKLVSDPWEKERASLISSFLQRNPQFSQ